MNKAYSRINWQNAPSEATALNEANLNKIDSAIDTIDDRVVAHDTRLDNAEYAIGQDENNITALQNGKVDKEEGKGISTLKDIEVIPVTRKGAFVGSIRTKDQSGNWTNKDFYNQTEVDSSLSQSSTNPLQNRVIWQQLSNKADKSTVNTALAGKVDKEEGYGLCNKSEISVEYPSGYTPTGTEVADIIFKTQDPTLPAIGFPIYNNVEVDNALSTESENPVQNKAVTAELENKADIDGNYEDMAVGQLLSNTFEEDKTPYNFRTSGGTLEIGDREYDTLVGGTVAFNQLINPSNWDSSDSDFVDGIKFTKNNDNSLTITIAEGGALAKRVYRLQANGTFPSHKVYGGKIGISGITLCNAFSTAYTKMSDTIYNNTATGANQWRLCICVDNGTGEGTYTIKPQLFDLTQMFNSTIADYIYSLEQATAGSGVAYFRSLFPKDYYAYNAGQLMSVKALSHKMVGFNAFDVTTGKAKLVGGNLYQITGTYTTISYSTGETLTPDSNGKFTPSASGELTVTGGNNTTCVHLVWDGERDGEYEAYEEHIYPLDSDLELRGIPKLDANNQLYYDGDTYESDGTVTRKYGVVDLGSLSWNYITTSDRNYFQAVVSGKKLGDMICPLYVYGGISTDSDMASKADKTIWNDASTSAPTIIKVKNSAYTDKDTFKTAMNGVYLVYELATPTTETADAFTNPQLVDNWGTEEYTDSRDIQIPVGHITKYPPDLKAKLESAPDSPSANGDYILRHNNGVNSYVALTKELPAVPTTDGTYVLKATVSSGVATLSWVAEE